MEKALAEVELLDLEFAAQLRAQIDLIGRLLNSVRQTGLTPGSDEAKKQALAIQIIEGNIAARRFDEILLSSISGTMIMVSSEKEDAFAKLLGVPVTDPSSLNASILKAPSKEHTAIGIRQSDLGSMSPEVLAALDRYKTAGFSIVLIRGGTPGEAVVMKTITAVTPEGAKALLAVPELPTDETYGFIDAQKVSEMDIMKLLISMFVAEQQISVAA